MKIRNGFVSNSSTSSFFIKTNKNNELVNIKDLLFEIFTDSDISKYYRNIDKLKSNIKYITDNDKLFYIDGDYDDTKIVVNDDKIILQSSYHYEWRTFLERIYEWCNDEDGIFYDEWYKSNKEDDYGNDLKANVFLPIYGLSFNNIKYDNCKKCNNYHKVYYLNNKQYCSYKDNFNILLRKLKIKTLI